MYDLIEVKSKLNIFKICIFTVSLLFCFIMILVIFVIKNVSNENNKIEDVKIVQTFSQDFSFQIPTKNKPVSQSFDSLNEEQLQKILNIYNDDGEKRVFLTFDDGPSTSVTPFILDLLQKENIKATFFVLGNRVERNPELVKRIFEEGHYIANHGYSHQYNSIYSSIDSVLAEYNKTETCIQKALQNENYHSNLFRFPGGSIGGKYHKIKQEAKQQLHEYKIAYLDWNALNNDSAGANTKEQLIENIISTVGNKNSVVILMHDANDKILTYETLHEVIEYLRNKGYKFQNIYDILNN